MKRTRLLGLAGFSALVLACQSDGDSDANVDGIEIVEEVPPSAAARTTSRGAGPRVPDETQVAAIAIDGADISGLDDEGFASNAFPPMLSNSDHHQNAWLRNDCLLCHADGLVGAPLVKHRGMSKVLLEANCRSCHVTADPDAGPLTNLMGEVVHEFASNAFPPTLPVDESHSMAWLRKDCLHCHRGGLTGAPKVRHHGMSELLLEANCRSCHVPGANSALTDVR